MECVVTEDRNIRPRTNHKETVNLSFTEKALVAGVLVVCSMVSINRYADAIDPVGWLAWLGRITLGSIVESFL